MIHEDPFRLIQVQIEKRLRSELEYQSFAKTKITKDAVQTSHSEQNPASAVC